jgi:hypothetical protein
MISVYNNFKIQEIISIKYFKNLCFTSNNIKYILNSIYTLEITKCVENKIYLLIK